MNEFEQTTIQFHPDGWSFGVASSNLVRMWDIRHNRIVSTFSQKFCPKISAIAFSHDGFHFAIANKCTGAVIFKDLRNPNASFLIQSDALSEVYDLCYCPHTDYLAVVGPDVR